MTENGPIEIKLTKEGRERLEQERLEEHGPDPDDPRLKAAARNLEELQRGREAELGKIDVDAANREQGARELEQYRQTQRRLWARHGGTDAEFEENWPQIKADHLRQKARDAYKDVYSPFGR